MTGAPVRACCAGGVHVPSHSELRMALVRAASAGKRAAWWQAQRDAERAFDAEIAKKTAGVLPGLLEEGK